MTPLVIVESPYGKAECTPAELAHREAYARACLADCLSRGEAPYASHLLYTQPGVLGDAIPSERTAGINAGLAWAEVASRSVVYTDLGVSRGMQLGIEHAQRHGRPVEYRTLGEDWHREARPSMVYHCRECNTLTPRGVLHACDP